MLCQTGTGCIGTWGLMEGVMGRSFKKKMGDRGMRSPCYRRYAVCLQRHWRHLSSHWPSSWIRHRRRGPISLPKLQNPPCCNLRRSKGKLQLSKKCGTLLISITLIEVSMDRYVVERSVDVRFARCANSPVDRTGKRRELSISNRQRGQTMTSK